MKMKRNKFMTFMFSLLPGAGHMFMGFMKTGLSLMAAFILVIFLSSFLNIAPLLFLLPLIWFYSFFDCLNKSYSPDEEFEKLEDRYLFSLQQLGGSNVIFKRFSLAVGLIVLFLGVYMLWNTLFDTIGRYMPGEIYDMVRNVTDIFPKFVFGIIIIVIGAKLIIGKKKESDGYDA